MNSTQYRGSTDTGNYLSPSIWGGFRVGRVQAGEHAGSFDMGRMRELKTVANINAAEAYLSGGWNVFGSNGAAIAGGDEVGGTRTFLSDGDDEGVSFRDSAPWLQIITTGFMTCFEIRLKTSTIADTKHGFFAGLMDSTAVSATVPIAAAGTLADVNFVGFHRLEGDGDMVDCVYKADTVTQVTVLADAKTLVADTYVKLGAVYLPSKKTLYYYANNVLLASKVIPTAAGTDFPNDVRLGRVFAVLNATATTPGNTEVEWFAAGTLLSA